MNYNQEIVEIIHELLGAQGNVAFIEYRNKATKRVAILKVENFYRRYGMENVKS